MGQVKWAAYTPEDINWSARSRVEAWGRHEHDIQTRLSERKSTHTGSGLIFMIVMIVILVLTIMKFA